MIKFENKTNARFYYLSVTCDLLGQTILSCTRGGKNVSVVNTVATGSREEIIKKILSLTRRRLSRGYTLIS